MKINLSSLYAGPLGSFGPGICDVPDAIATDLIEAMVAIPVVEIQEPKEQVADVETALAIPVVEVRAPQAVTPAQSASNKTRRR